jgi:hypothetical protein
MLPTNQTAAYTAQSIADYQTLAAREPALPPALGDFLALLGPGAKDRHAERQAALSAAIRCLQADPPEGPSIRLWLLVTYAPALQALAVRYRTPGATLDESGSAAAWAFLETLQALSAERLSNPWLAREIERDTQRRLAYHGGLWDGNRKEQVDSTPDESLMGDRIPDDRADAYQALEDLIQDMPVTEDERTLLSGLYVYGYTLQEMADMTGETYGAVQQRFNRLKKRLQRKTRRNL